MKIIQRIIYAPRNFILLILWTAFHALVFGYGFLKQRNDPTLHSINRIGLSVYISRGAGLVLAIDAALLLLPICRTLIVLIAPILSGKLGIPLGHPSGFHKLIAYTMLLFTIVHVAAHFKNFFALEGLHVATALSLHLNTWAGTTGHLMLIVMIIIYVAAHKPIRRARYNIFQGTHRLYIVFYILITLHPLGCFVKTDDGECKPYLSFRYILPVVAIYLAELLARIYRSRRNTSIIEAIKHPGGVVELRIDAPWIKFTAGQHVFLKIPAISQIQWHPFTITSAPNEKFISFHIHRIGDWSNTVGALCVDNRTTADTKIDMRDSTFSQLAPPPSLPISIRLDGPFGTFTTTLYDHDVAILVGGGIGVTPFASILKDIIWRHKNKNTGRMRRVEFYWICRNMASFEWFRDELGQMEDECFDGFLRVFTHVTSKEDVLPSEDMARSMLSLPIRNSLLVYAKTLLEADPVVRTTRGRPDFAKVFDSVEAEASAYSKVEKSPKKTDVGVFVCGPTPLRQSIIENIRFRRKDDVKFGMYWS